MRSVLVIACALSTSLVGAVIAALYHHKKVSAADIKLLGEIARVSCRLDPDGTVLVSGELWRAKSIDNSMIPAQTKVLVVGFQDHLALVRICH
jgi:membrane-bound ClpP family serine protease